MRRVRCRGQLQGCSGALRGSSGEGGAAEAVTRGMQAAQSDGALDGGRELEPTWLGLGLGLVLGLGLGLGLGLCSHPSYVS